MRKITFLKTMLLAAVLLVGSGNAWAAETTSIINENFQGFTSTSYSTTPASQTVGTGTWTYTDAIFSPTAALSGTGTKGNVQMKSATGVLELPLIVNGGVGNVSFNVKVSSASGAQIKLEMKIGSTGIWQNVNTWTSLTTSVATYSFDINEASANIYLRFTNPGSRANTFHDIIVTPAPPTCTASDLAFANPTVSKTTADAPFTVAATSLNVTTAITYASDNTAAATVNETTGEITVVGAGTAKITATQAAGTHAAVDYCASTAEYTLTVASTTPTITITETSYETMGAVVGSTDTQTLHVSGINLTGDIEVYFRVDNSDRVKGKSVNIFILRAFEVSPESITPTDGTVTSTPITITFRPLEEGTHRATLVVSSDGANTVEYPFEGIATWAPLPAPVATDASGVNNAGFTANWEAVAEATEYDVDVYTKETGPMPANDLFFSEYIEGGSSNKAIEIYNGTGASVDLSNYSVELYANGATVATSTLTMTGTLANGDVYVIYNSDSADEIKNVGNVESTVTYFGGDDALVLKRDGRIIDSFGQVGVDPGSAWSANGVTTLDKTLVRKPTVTDGRTAATTVFDPSVEWIQYDMDTFDYLGSHTMTATSVVTTPIAGSPFTVIGETSKAVSGLSAETTYYYRVTAYNNFVGSDVSNEVSVTTGSTTGVDKTEGNLNVGVSGNQIQFSASANQTVEVFNAVGQKLISRQTVDGLNTLTVSARGVVFVKLGDKVTKVIL